MIRFYAWFLLLITCLQWVAGTICVEIMQSAVVEVPMDPLEKKLSEALKKEWGHQTYVNKVEKADLDIEQVGYSNFFLFSKELDGETHYYTVDQDRFVDVQLEKVLPPLEHSQEKDTPILPFKGLFSPFICFFPDIFCLNMPNNDGIKNFDAVLWTDLFILPTSCPPPDISTRA